MPPKGRDPTTERQRLHFWMTFLGVLYGSLVCCIRVFDGAPWDLLDVMDLGLMVFSVTMLVLASEVYSDHKRTEEFSIECRRWYEEKSARVGELESAIVDHEKLNTLDS